MIRIPRHIAIIMDGNRRWAKAKGLPETMGHIAGEEALVQAVEAGSEIGVEVLSVFAFSTENWLRDKKEVKFLMRFSTRVVRRNLSYLNRLNVRIIWSGRQNRVPRSVRLALLSAQKRTQNNTGLILNLCVDYGSQEEIATAVQTLLWDVVSGRLSLEDLACVSDVERAIKARFYTPELLDVDLVVRTSGELRVSNFLLWQSAYAEYVFIRKPWPEFKKADLFLAVEEFGRRHRRYGADGKGAHPNPLPS